MSPRNGHHTKLQPGEPRKTNQVQGVLQITVMNGARKAKWTSTASFFSAAVIVLGGCSKDADNHSAPPPPNNVAAQPSMEPSAEPATKRKVLDHSNYVGKVKMGYMAAEGAPEVCEKLFCYCGCDYTDEHASLLDCFTSDHGVDCIYCQGEAVMAFKMKKKGSSIADIQKAIDLNWGPKYPFYEQPSDAIKRYWKTRLWSPGVGPTVAEKHNESTPLLDPFTGNRDSSSKPMTSGEDSKKGDCCGGKKEKNDEKVQKSAN